MSTRVERASGLGQRSATGGLCARALSGLTAHALALVTALLVIRVVGGKVSTLLDHGRAHRLDIWFLGVIVSSAMLLLMAIPMLIGVTAVSNLGPQHGTRRLVSLVAAVVLSSLVGIVLRLAVQDWLGTGSGWEALRPFLHYLWPRYALLCGMLTVAAEFYRREVASIESMQRAELERASLEREMAEARLQALQAQIEPHFLFNTLANLRRLYDTSHAAGRRLLDDLMRYLEVALPQMRQNTSTIGRDSELVEAFLRLQQVRMGTRLAYSIEIPAELRAHPVPPMMLLTLVENAIKHGLAPSVLGGFVRVAAHAEDTTLTLSVADTGVGFGPGSGGGIGLANIRARLATQFGDQAELGLENNDLGGVTATLTLPFVRTRAHP